MLQATFLHNIGKLSNLLFASNASDHVNLEVRHLEYFAFAFVGKQEIQTD